jgi:EAL domain-containing protein (putative c-di-GMP-specific phosphodiesterase class I)
MRLHSVSIYDSQGNVLWLSEGALGPDEHSLVLEALEVLTAQTATSCCENKLEDGRVAAFLAVRAPQGHLVGLTMILADLKSGGEGLTDRIMSAPTRTVMQKLAVLLRPAGARRLDGDPTGLVLSLAGDAPVGAPEPQVLAAPVAAAKARSGFKGGDDLSPGAMNDILEFELTDAPILAPARHPADEARGSPVPQQGPATNGHSRTNGDASPADSATSAIRRAPVADTASVRAPATWPLSDTASARVLKAAPADTTSAKLLRQTTGDTTSAKLPRQTPGDTSSSRNLAAPSMTGASRALSLDPALVTLEMLPFVKLRSGGRTRRFEVLPAGTARELRDPATLDSLAMHRLLAWLGANRAAWTVEPASFTLNISIATLEDDEFLKQVAAGLQGNSIAPDTVGFEIAEPLCTQRRAQVERFMAGCEKLGCCVIIDDFSFDSAVVPLLRSKAVRLVKIDSRLTAGALRDKLSQAMVVAVVQAVKVLGMHCAAQQVDSQAALQWLTAIGCDFAQGPMLARQQPLEQLLGAAS